MGDKLSKLRKIRKAIRDHVNWLVYTTVGSTQLTEEELKEVKKLNIKYDYVDNTYYSYYLGKYKAEEKPSKYKTLTWKEFLKYTRDRDLSPEALNSVRFARDKSGLLIKSFADDLANSIFKELQKAAGDTINEATLKEIIQDEAAFAVLENHNYKQFAKALETRLNTKGKKDWESIARTELNSARQQGYVATIASKEGIYAKSNGLDSKVSVVPQPGACVDCIDLYTTNGIPKVFTIRELIDNGINTNHKKVNGKHIHWKPVIPSLHNRCFCQIAYIPPGYSWVDGKLSLTDKEALVKAFEGNFATKKVANPPSLPGVSSPAQTGNTPGVAANPGSGVEYEYWPSGKGKPPKDGGWESYKKKDGLVGHRRPKGSGSRGPGAQEEEKDPAQAKAEAKAWGKTPKSQELVINHLAEGTIVDKEGLGDAAGVTESWRVTIEGNGRGIMKPPALHDNIGAQAGMIIADGAGSCPVGTGHIREKAAFYAANALGMAGKVPPTVTRSYEGQPTSIQAWSETKSAIAAKLAKGELGDVSEYQTYSDGSPIITNETQHILKNLPDDKRDKFLAGAMESTAFALILNHNDQHFGNVLIDDDMNFSFIDNSFSLGTSVYGNKSQFHFELHNMGYKVRVPESVMSKLEVTTLADLKRGMGDHIEDWAVGQTFLRMKYVEYLQKTEGHLDYEKFRPCIRAGASNEALTKLQDKYRDNSDPAAVKYVKSVQEQKGGPHGHFWNGSKAEQTAEYENREANGLLAHQLFDSFAKQWIIDNIQRSDDHPDKAAAAELAELGVFMDPAGGFTLNPEQYRADGKHRDYEHSIKPGYPPADIKSAVTTGQKTVSTKGTTPSQRKKFKKPESNEVKTAKAPTIPTGNKVEPQAYANTHLQLDLDEKAPVLAKLQEKDVDDAFDSIMMGDSTSTDSDEEIIDLSDEIEMLSMFEKSRKARLYIL